METHGAATHTARVRLSPGRCLQCGICSAACSSGALVLERPAMVLRFAPERCVGCGECVQLCPTRAVTMPAPVRVTATRGSR